jgi:hypothetical protein
VLWAISTHFDKYLVKNFKHSDVVVLPMFTAFRGLLTLPSILVNEPTVFQIDPGSTALIARFGVLYALMFAPLAIVQTIGATTTLFVFVFAVVLSVLFPHLARETLSLHDLAQKDAAAVPVGLGVALVTR